ncbi:MAG TPA: cell envelope integrity protein CreD [Bryobacteraceae bacterium]|nr:cell envelope integrity protein CreD [Bryobacteraceae bacterium]
MGLKLIVVCGLALLMGIPAILVSSLVDERAQRAASVVEEISRHVGGAQTFLGPTLAIPYTVSPPSSAEPPNHSVYLVFPARASAVLKTSTEERHRSLFRVPVYEADLKFDADFDLSDVPNSAVQNAQLNWSQAEIVVGVTDAHGALADAMLSVDNKILTMVPASVAGSLPLGSDTKQQTKLVLFAARPANAIKAQLPLHVTATLRFSGAERISVLAYGKTTQLTAEGDWRNPGFDGGILPLSRDITNHGFTAKWSVPFIARGVRDQGPIDSITGLNTTALGLSFIEMADPYQSVNRSLKYALLFLGLVFLSYFVFEVTTGKRVHPAQYILVGIAQIIFYLLLLSGSERIGFDWSFLIAGTATVILLSTNAGWVFSSRAHGIRALLIFSILYSLIYLLLRLEDNALLIGAIASFFVVAGAMYLTRRIDWYTASHEKVT